MGALLLERAVRADVAGVGARESGRESVRPTDAAEIGDAKERRAASPARTALAALVDGMDARSGSDPEDRGDAVERPRRESAPTYGLFVARTVPRIDPLHCAIDCASMAERLVADVCLQLRQTKAAIAQRATVQPTAMPMITPIDKVVVGPEGGLAALAGVTGAGPVATMGGRGRAANAAIDDENETVVALCSGASTLRR